MVMPSVATMLPAALALATVWLAGAAEGAASRWAARARAWLHAERAYVHSVPPLLGIAAVSYFYRLAHFALSIDDELAAYRGASTVWVVQGRWLNYWLERFVSPQPTLPFLPDALFCLALVLSYLLLLRSFVIRPSWRTNLTFPLFAAHPALLVLNEFAANVLPAAVGFLLATTAVFLTGAMHRASSRRGVALLVAGNTLALACAVAAYQSFLFYYLACVSFALLLATFQTQAQAHGQPHGGAARAVLRRAVALPVLAALGCVAYAVLQRVHLHLLVGSQQMVYVDNFINLRALLGEPLAVLRRGHDFARQAYGGSQAMYGLRVHGLAMLLVCGTYAVLDRAWRSRDVGVKLLLPALLLQLLAAPFLINLTGGYFPVRVYVAVPFVAWGMAYLALQQRLTLLRGLGVAAVVVTLGQIALVSAHYSAAMDLALSRDKALASAVQQALAASRPDFDPRARYKLDIYGQMAWEKGPYATAVTATTDASFFDWDNGNPIRMATFLRLLGLGTYDLLQPERRRELMPHFEKMPSWPQPGCVQWEGDTALLKLSATPGYYN